MYKFDKTHLYGVNLTCFCGCRTEVRVFRYLGDAVIFGEALSKNIKARLVEFKDCEDLKDGRFIWKHLVLSEGYIKADLEGDSILRFFNVR
jgi:hypothetical protein